MYRRKKVWTVLKLHPLLNTQWARRRSWRWRLRGCDSSEEAEETQEMRQVSEENGFRKDERPIKAYDGTTWEWHLHEDERQYYYCLDTRESRWTLPEEDEKMVSDEVADSPSGNELDGRLRWVLHRLHRQLSLQGRSKVV